MIGTDLKGWKIKGDEKKSKWKVGAAVWDEKTPKKVSAGDLKGGYQVVVADLNHDGRPDLIALASGLHELLWFENPGWQRHVLATNQNRMINCVMAGDEIVLASEFNNEAKNSVGVVSVLRRGADPNEPWTVTEIDRLPTSHSAPARPLPPVAARGQADCSRAG